MAVVVGGPFHATWMQHVEMHAMNTSFGEHLHRSQNRDTFQHLFQGYMCLSASRRGWETTLRFRVDTVDEVRRLGVPLYDSKAMVETAIRLMGKPVVVSKRTWHSCMWHPWSLENQTTFKRSAATIGFHKPMLIFWIECNELIISYIHWLILIQVQLNQHEHPFEQVWTIVGSPTWLIVGKFQKITQLDGF